MVELLCALSALLVIVVTPAHIVVMVSLRNDRRIGMLRTATPRSNTHRGDEALNIRNYSLITSSQLTRASSVNSDMSSISNSRHSMRSDTQHSQHSARSQRMSRSASRSRSRSRSPSRALALLSRGISKLYMSRLLGVLAVITAPLMLDLIQCLPLLAAHFFETGKSRLTYLFLPLLVAFLLPRFALLALSSLTRRIRYDMSTGAHVETFEYTSVFSMALGLGTTEADKEVWELEKKALDPLWSLRFGPLGILSGQCFISIRYFTVCFLVIIFPHTAALFLILDNIAKVAAAGERLTQDETDVPVRGGSGASTVSGVSGVSHMSGVSGDGSGSRGASNGSSRRSNVSGTSSMQSDKDGVQIGPEDQENARLLAGYLLVAFGSQLLICSTYDWPILHGSFHLDHKYHSQVVILIVWVELVLALALALAVTTGLGSRVWRRVRVVFVNRASLWLSATARNRGVPTPNRVLSPNRRPVHHSTEPSLITTPTIF